MSTSKKLHKRILSSILHVNRLLLFLVLGTSLIALGTISIHNLQTHFTTKKITVLGTASAPFIASIDTMKESRDTETHPLSDTQIAQDVNLTATLNTTHITVATNWDYTSYFRTWANIIHKAGKHIWVRGHPNQWENNNGTTGIMSPSSYENYEKNFILQNADVFQAGDIFDPASEPELGLYWHATYPTWTNATTSEYNQFLRDSTDVANSAFAQKGIVGVITSIHSTNAWMAIHRLEPATIAKMGVVTIDSYPDQYDTTVSQAVNDRVNDITAVYNAVHVPVVLGEIGYSNKIQVDDQTQAAVLQGELNAIQSLSYVIGANYWVGAGGPGHGGYTNILTGSAGNWTLRPAANIVADFFKSEEKLTLQNSSITPTLTQIPTIQSSSQSSLSNSATSTISCPPITLSVKVFCDRTDSDHPLAKATFSWTSIPLNNVTYNLSYGRQGRNMSTETTNQTTITLPNSTTYGLYTDGSVYLSHVEYSTSTCAHQMSPQIQFTPQSCTQ